MNKNRIILAVLLALVLVAGFVVWQKRPLPAIMRLELTGTPGLKVAGTVIVDGVPREFSGTLPTHIAVTARTIEYTIQMQEPRGELRGELKVGEEIYGTSNTANDFSGVKGGYRPTWSGKGGFMTTVNKGDQRPKH